MSLKTTNGIAKLLGLYLNKESDRIRELETNRRKKYESHELEIRYGTKNIKHITKIDFDNLISKLLSSNFERTHGYEQYTLKIQSEYMDTHTGRRMISKVRTEISGLDAIQEYCRTNEISESMILNNHVKFINKSYIENGGQKVYPIDIPDYNARIALQKEITLSPDSGMIKGILESWKDTKKIFRYIYRTSFEHKMFKTCYRYDLSIVKSSKIERGDRFPTPTYTFEESGVLTNIETYEIEQEHMYEDFMKETADNHLARVNSLLQDTKNSIKQTLGGLQQSNYPISYPKQSLILREYVSLFDAKRFMTGNNPQSRYKQPRISSKDFIGPSSHTLQLQNIGEDSNIKMPNIRVNYTVTEKADGLRKLLYISKDRLIYLIDMNMGVQFTGSVTNNDKLVNTLLDGEHILHNKQGKFINIYAAFDIYFLGGIDIRSCSFFKVDSIEEETKTSSVKTKTSLVKKDPLSEIYRLDKLIRCIKKLNTSSIIENQPSPITIVCKEFHAILDSENRQGIFGACKNILDKINNTEFIYNTDGLVFTPCIGGVGIDNDNNNIVNYKKAWSRSLKWKPPEFNTIDFLVTIEKSQAGNDKIGNLFETGRNVSSNTEQILQYKTLILRVGFDENKHGYINPVNSVLQDEDIRVDNSRYKPVPFYPTDPYDENAHKCNIMLHDTSEQDRLMFTEENEVIEDKTIIEFRYDKTKPILWRWIPLRVRYDKTAEFKKGQNNFGNAYHTANNNWYSIHHPITEDMLKTGVNIPEQVENKDVYYNTDNAQKHKDLTRSLRDFHNLYIKNKLICGVSNHGNTLIDYSVGKGGDLPKWIYAKLSFVFGIDISKDNIENRLDGIYARYLNYRKQYHSIPSGLFVNGDSSKNIKNGDAMVSEKDKLICATVMGTGSKDKKVLGDGLYQCYGNGRNGFNISSCQFSLHYFFESIVTVTGFLRNISECTRIGGYFIGTCYDGLSLFRDLNTKPRGECIQLNKKNQLIWKITKDYDITNLSNDYTSLGLAIDVFQESINKTFKEYLVNFSYLTTLMQHYGFELITDDEASGFNFSSGSNLFKVLYDQMMKETKTFKLGQAKKMSHEEKQISFYGRYFIFKKVRDIDTVNMGKTLISAVESEIESMDQDHALVENTQDEEKAQAITQVITQVIRPSSKSNSVKPKLKLKIGSKSLRPTTISAHDAGVSQETEREKTVGMKGLTLKIRPSVISEKEVGAVDEGLEENNMFDGDENILAESAESLNEGSLINKDYSEEK